MMFQRTLRIGQTAVAIFLAALGGYLLRGLQNKCLLSTPDNGVMKLEYFLVEQSFSEVENTKAMLDALANYYITTLRDIRCGFKYASGLSSENECSEQETQFSSTIKALELGIEEFKGTDQEFVMIGELLRVLKMSKSFDRWIDVYLELTYRHPTHDLVGRFAKDAMRFGRETGRESDVLLSFRHINAIPIDFMAKHKINEELHAVNELIYLTQSDSGSIFQTFPQTRADYERSK